MSEDGDLEVVEVQTSATADAAVIWLHGLGADGYDFVPIVRELQSLGAPPARFVFPHAPQRPITINGGYVMRGWYDIADAQLVRQEDADGIRQSQRQVERLIAREVGRGIPPGRIVLGGFSQGAAITLQAGLRATVPLAGLAALSGYLPLAATLAGERSAAAAATPVFMAHGSSDPVVSIERGTASRDHLLELGMAVEWHTYPMEHSVCAEELRDLVTFLGRILAPLR
jgi:phospholipase/carboxylesterase